MTITYVYHIRKDGQALQDGYIGVTNRPESREKEHFSRIANHKHSNAKLQENCNEDYKFHILICAEESYCYEFEQKLRPKKNIGLNIAPGGRTSPVCFESAEQRKSRIDKSHKTIIERYGNFFHLTEERRYEIWNKETGTGNFLKRNRKGLVGNEFTSHSASELAKRRSAEKTLPAQISAINKTHHWYSEEHKKNTSKRNSEKFFKTVSVTDKFGITSRIASEVFQSQQIVERIDWKYVGSASKEAKERRDKCQ